MILDHNEPVDRDHTSNVRSAFPPGNAASDPTTAGTPATLSMFSRASFTMSSHAPMVSIVTIAILFALWWLASHLRWLPPLFLPTPETIFTRLYESATGRLTDAPLVIGIVSFTKPHPKVPPWEQELSAGEFITCTEFAFSALNEM